MVVLRFLQLEQRLVGQISQKVKSVSIALDAKKLIAQNPDSLWQVFKQSKEAFLLDSNLQTMNTLIELNQFLPLKIFDSELAAYSQENIEVEKDTLRAPFWKIKQDGMLWGEINFPVSIRPNLVSENFLIDISKDDAYALVFSKRDKEGFIWQQNTAQAIYSFTLNFDPKSISFSPDASAFIISDKLGANQVWAGWQKLILNDESIQALAISSNDSIIATGGQKGILRFWSKQGEFIRTLNTKQGNINQIIFLDDGSERFIVASNKGVRLWEAKNGLYDSERIDNFRSKNLKRAIPVSGKHPAAYILIAEKKGSVYVYSLEDKENIIEFGAEKNNLSNAAAYLGDPSIIVTAHDDILRLWNWENQLMLDSIILEQSINSIDISPDGTALLIACSDHNAYLFNLNSDQKLPGQKPVELHHIGAVNGARFSQDGNWIITASSDHTAKIWSREGEWLTSFIFENIILDAYFTETGNEIIVLDDHHKCQIILIDPRKIIEQFEHTYHHFKPNKNEDI